jgi:hypothetical protein
MVMVVATVEVDGTVVAMMVAALVAVAMPVPMAMVAVMVPVMVVMPGSSTRAAATRPAIRSFMEGPFSFEMAHAAGTALNRF